MKLGASADFQKAELSTGPDNVEMSPAVQRVELESDSPRTEMGDDLSDQVRGGKMQHSFRSQYGLGYPGIVACLLEVLSRN